MSDLGMIVYDVTDAAIAELKGRYSGLKIVDSSSYEHVRVAIAEVRTKRTGVEKMRKDLKADALTYGKRVDAEAKRLTDALKSIEDPLQTEKDRVDAEKEKVRQEKAAKEQDRVDGIRARISAFQHLLVEIQGKTSDQIMENIDNTMDCEAPEEIFMEFTAEANKVKEEVINGLIKAYQEKLKVENEAEALKVEQDRLAKIAAEQKVAQGKIDEDNRKIREAQEKLEAEKKAEKDRQERDALAQRLKEQAEKEAKERFDREARENKEKEETEEKERQKKAAMAPDREKLLAFADLLENVKAPQVDSDKAFVVLSDALRGIRGIVSMLRKEGGAL